MVEEINWEEYWKNNRMTWESNVGHDTFKDTKTGEEYYVTGNYFTDRAIICELCQKINALENIKQDLIQALVYASREASDLVLNEKELVFDE